MTTQEIFEKYWDAMVTTNIRLGGFDENVVRTILHLAIRDVDLGARNAAAASLIDDRDSWRALAEGLKADVADLHQRLAATLQKCDSQALRVVGLEAMVADQPGYEEQQNRLMRWLIDNEPEASRACDADQGVAGAIIDILEKQRQAIANYDAALSHAQNEAAMLRQQRADLQADLDVMRRELAPAATAAPSPDPTPTPGWGLSHPAWMAEASSITQYVESNKWQDVVTVALMDTASR